MYYNARLGRRPGLKSVGEGEFASANHSPSLHTERRSTAATAAMGSGLLSLTVHTDVTPVELDPALTDKSLKAGRLAGPASVNGEVDGLIRCIRERA
jgi:hypothetical protein